MDPIVFEKTLATALGSFSYKLIISIIVAIPAWFLLTTIKDFISLKMKRQRLINDTILSIDSYYKINGSEGYLREIGSRQLKLESEDRREIVYIPIAIAVDALITKKHPESEEKHAVDDAENPARK